jgi:hypothetical protein
MDEYITEVPSITPQDVKPFGLKNLVGQLSSACTSVVQKLAVEALGLQSSQWLCYVYFKPKGITVEIFPKNETAALLNVKMWNAHCACEIAPQQKVDDY